MTLQDWSDVAQILASLLTLTGVVASIWVALRTLREVHHDRKLRHKPHLAFLTGGHRIRIAFVKGDQFVPGVNRAYAKRVLSHLPAIGESVVIKTDDSAKGSSRRYAVLHNYGAGAALNVKVTWVPEAVWINGERFELNDEKRNEPLYGKELNRMPSVPAHMEPSGESSLTRLPAFIVKDYDKKITQAEGHLLIECQDIFESNHQFKQEFSFFTYYKDEEPAVHATFH